MAFVLRKETVMYGSDGLWSPFGIETSPLPVRGCTVTSVGMACGARLGLKQNIAVMIHLYQPLVERPCGARLVLKLKRLEYYIKYSYGRNGLWSPVGFETPLPFHRT